MRHNRVNGIEISPGFLWPDFAAFQIGLDLLSRTPHRPHLLLRKKRELVVDVFRTFLRPVTVTKQRFSVDRSGEFDHREVSVAAFSLGFAIDEGTEVNGPYRSHH
jgi:hypothetical protein